MARPGSNPVIHVQLSAFPHFPYSQFTTTQRNVGESAKKVEVVVVQNSECISWFGDFCSRIVFFFYDNCRNSCVLIG